MPDQTTVIAIDGPSASGKGTLARRLATYFDFAHLDTGLLYRAVGLAVLTAGASPDDAADAERAALHLDPATLSDLSDNPALRQDQVSIAASRVAAIPCVRAALLTFQKDFCAHPPSGKHGAVLDGRDIGTIIAPEARIKIFVTASIEARAGRRFRELQGRGDTTSHADILAAMTERDKRDEERTAAPAKPAADAFILDTTAMTADEALNAAIHYASNRLK